MTNSSKFLLLIALCSIAFIGDILLGSVVIPFSELWQSITSVDDTIYYEIIVNHRLPKALTAIFVGASLAASGLLMQTLFKNPLAGPDVLGINSGASLGVALLTLGGFSVSSLMGGSAQILAAILGAVSILLLVILVSTRIKNSVSLLIVGVMFGYFTSSIVSILQNISNPDTLKLFITWTFGSLSAPGWTQLQVLIPILLITLFASTFIIKQLNVFLLGTDYAQGVGIHVKQTRFFIILLTAILTGTATAFTGPIGFIGITMPHIARGIFKTSNHRIILPASILLGASILMACDIVSQLPWLNSALPINAVTSLFGAPIVLWIMLKRK